MSLDKDIFKQCHYCGSTIHLRSGYPHCSGDNLPELKVAFDAVLSLEHSNPKKFESKLENIRDIDELFDVFVGYWHKHKSDKSAPVTCPHNEERQISVAERHSLMAAGIPMPDPFIPFPDLVEVYIAEIMLDRGLTDLEKEGSRHIPKISEEGVIYFAPLTWVVYPHSYMSIKDMVIKTDYECEPLPKLFDIDEIRGMFRGRDGGIYDE